MHELGLGAAELHLLLVAYLTLTTGTWRTF